MTLIVSLAVPLTTYCAGTGALAIAAGISKSEAADPANRFDDFDMSELMTSSKFLAFFISRRIL